MLYADDVGAAPHPSVACFENGHEPVMLTGGVWRAVGSGGVVKRLFGEKNTPGHLDPVPGVLVPGKDDGNGLQFITVRLVGEGFWRGVTLGWMQAGSIEKEQVDGPTPPGCQTGWLTC